MPQALLVVRPQLGKSAGVRRFQVVSTAFAFVREVRVLAKFFKRGVADNAAIRSPRCLRANGPAAFSARRWRTMILVVALGHRQVPLAAGLRLSAPCANRGVGGADQVRVEAPPAATRPARRAAVARGKRVMQSFGWPGTTSTGAFDFLPLTDLDDVGFRQLQPAERVACST